MELRGAVIGCGRMGVQNSTRFEGVIPAGWLPISHAECFVKTNGVELIALADNDKQRLTDAGVGYSVKSLHENYKDMLRTEKLDIVSIATRTPLKSEIIYELCKSEVKGIYVEKPLANSIGECRRILDVVKSSTCVISYGVNRRFHHAYRKAKEIISSKELGELREVVVEFGVAPLLWSHPHSMDLLVYFAGRPTHVRADLNPESFNKVDSDLIDSDPLIDSAQFLFLNGVRGSISIGGGAVVRLNFSDGTLIIHGDGAYIQQSTRSNPDSPYFLDQKTYHPQSPRGATHVAFDELVSVVNGGVSKQEFNNLISPLDIQAGMEMLIGCAWSHMNSNQFIDINNVPSELTVTGRSGSLFA